ncbi:hypothetical protein WHR41_05646 [Cladosporium halotolerans]|uniref:palmitoyl-protein hydrolase n=1 Tax=Cladosporium halotolerans TaxID=1052096 RepID=A0AB34KP38_9PEZI
MRLTTLLPLLPLATALPPPATTAPSSSSSTSTNNNNNAAKPLPLLIWHGLGDRSDASGLHTVGQLASQTHPGTLVHYISLPASDPLDGAADQRATFFGNVSAQIASVCASLSTNTTLLDPASNRIRADALGFSQGGQFLRGLAQRCPALQLRSLVTFGSQHAGISEFQRCGAWDLLCKAATALVGGNAWTDTVQGGVVPAQYYREVNETTGEGTEAYLAASHFLADVNAERGGGRRNEEYAARLGALENFAMYVFAGDETVVPKESGWFAEVNGTSGEVTPLRERRVYKEDWIGLRELDRKGGLVFGSVEGEHMQLDKRDLERAFGKYFGPEREGRAVEGVEKEGGGQVVLGAGRKGDL